MRITAQRTIQIDDSITAMYNAYAVFKTQQITKEQYSAAVWAIMRSPNTNKIFDTLLYLALHNAKKALTGK